ncbi:MAG: HNH endonuclease [Deltaproteobacteria bacterium]|nr:HNH endonuclease [Deltaproteobacteria bacterium]
MKRSHQTRTARLREQLRRLYPDIRTVEPIDGADDFFVTDDGRVFSCRSEVPRLLKPMADRGMQLRVSLRTNKGLATSRSIAGLVALRYLPRPPSPPEQLRISHRNGNRSDNRVENLVWMTRSELWARPRRAPAQPRARVDFSEIRGAFPGAGELGYLEGRVYADDEGTFYRRSRKRIVAYGGPPRRPDPENLLRARYDAEAVLGPPRASQARLEPSELVKRIRAKVPDAPCLVVVERYPNYAIDQFGNAYFLVGDRVRKVGSNSRSVTEVIEATYPDDGLAVECPNLPGCFVTEAGNAYSANRFPLREVHRIALQRNAGSVVLRAGNSTYSLAHLVARAFLGPPPTRTGFVEHLNGDASDCRKANLRWRNRDRPGVSFRELFDQTKRGKGPARGIAEWSWDALTVADPAGGHSEAAIAFLHGMLQEVGTPGGLVPDLSTETLFRKIRSVDPEARGLAILEEFQRYAIDLRGCIYELEPSIRKTALREPLSQVEVLSKLFKIRVAPVPASRGHFVTSGGEVISWRLPGALPFVHARSGKFRPTLGVFAGGPTTRVIARLVAEAFLPPPSQPSFVAHKNGDWNDSRVENLFWKSRSDRMREQMKDRTARGRSWTLEERVAHVRASFPEERGKLVAFPEDPTLLVSPEGAVYDTRERRPRRRGRHLRPPLAQIVASTLVSPKPNPFAVVGFADGNPRNLHPRNLFWRSSHTKKLAAADATEIRRRRASGETQVSLASSFGVNQTTISSILRRLTFRDVP